MVVDRRCVELIVGQKVKVYRGSETRVATVVKPMKGRPTVHAPGHWVDIDFGDGPQGMPSYLLEVVQ